MASASSKPRGRLRGAISVALASSDGIACEPSTRLARPAAMLGRRMTTRPGPGRELAEAVLRDVIAACDPAHRVREVLGEPAIAARLAGRRRLALAVGKAALAMARGAGEVADGIAVVPAGGAGALPRGWRVIEAAHPVPDERSVAAGAALRALIAGAGDGDGVLALISGGASALAELPAAGPAALGELVATVQQVMAAGAAIDEINAV